MNLQNKDREYEAACVTAAQQASRFDIEHRMRQADEHIAALEKSLERAREHRRALVNLYNVNKGEK